MKYTDSYILTIKIRLHIIIIFYTHFLLVRSVQRNRCLRDITK